VRFRVADLEFNATVPEVRDDGLTIQFRAPKQAVHEQLVEAARTRGTLVSLDDDRQWRIAEANHTYVGNEPWGVYHHFWRLELLVRTSVGWLSVDDLEMRPYDYREETSADGVLRLAFRAAASDERLRDLVTLIGHIVQVRREQREPCAMLLEALVWGRSSAHRQAVAVVCTSQTEPRVTLAGATGIEPRLLAILQQQGVLPTEDMLALRRVEDVDAWDL
jgi:hypothetical protein